MSELRYRAEALGEFWTDYRGFHILKGKVVYSILPLWGKTEEWCLERLIQEAS